MSTSEQSTSIYCACPCGRGTILRDDDSPDNPWSVGSHGYRIDCSECDKTWIVSGGALHNRAEEEAKSKAYKRRFEIEEILQATLSDAIDHILADAGLHNNYKAEHKFLKEAGICTEGPILYKRARGSGANAGARCKPISNIAWITARLQDKVLAGRIEKLMVDRTDCEAQIKMAQQETNTIRIESLRGTSS